MTTSPFWIATSRTAPSKPVFRTAAQVGMVAMVTEHIRVTHLCMLGSVLVA